MSGTILPEFEFAYKRSADEEKTLKKKLYDRTIDLFTVLNGKNEGLFTPEQKEGLGLLIKEVGEGDLLSLDDLDTRWVLEPKYAKQVDPTSAPNGIYLGLPGDDLSSPLTPESVYALFWNWIKDQEIGQQSMRAQLGSFALRRLDVEKERCGQINADEIELTLYVNTRLVRDNLTATQVIEHAKPGPYFYDEMKRFLEMDSSLRTSVENEEREDPFVMSDLERLGCYRQGLIKMAKSSEPNPDEPPFEYQGKGYNMWFDGANHRIYCSEGVQVLMDSLRDFRNGNCEEKVLVLEEQPSRSDWPAKPPSYRSSRKAKTEMIEML